MAIHDDGIGFDHSLGLPGTWAWPPCGAGHRLGGRLDIASAPGSGTTITATVPSACDQTMEAQRERAAACGPIRVLVADDHRVVRQGLWTFLATTDDIRVVGEASDGSETLTQLHGLHDRGEAPDVVLMDLLMSPWTGSRRPGRSAPLPEVQVVALTSFVEEEKAYAAPDAGASGSCSKTPTRTRLRQPSAPPIAARCTWTPPSPAASSRRCGPEHAATRPRATGENARCSGCGGRQGQQGIRRRVVHQRAHRAHPREQDRTKLGMIFRTRAASWAVREASAQRDSRRAATVGQKTHTGKTHRPCPEHPWRCSIST